MADFTAKEVTALNEELGGEQVLVAKYKGMAAMCSDPVIKSKLELIAQRHQSHYDRIAGLLK